MKKFLAIAIYRSYIQGVASDSLDFQTRYYKDESDESVRESIETQVPESFKNSTGEAVEWRLVKIMAVDELLPVDSGDELIGFIAQKAEIMDMFKEVIE